MGCCCSSSKSVDERSSLIQNEDSHSKYDKSFQSLPTRPKCKCGAHLNPYELQCCYMNDSGDGFSGKINCELCGKVMSNPNDIVWHCLNRHNYTYDLCWECGTNISTKNKLKEQDRKEEEEEIDEKTLKKELKFDPIHNIDGIDWNKLYDIICDEAKSLKVNKTIKENVDLSNIEKYNFSTDILKFIDDVQHQVKMTHFVHKACNENIGWTIQTESDNICISYKKEENTPFHSIKSDFLCKCTVLDFIAVINEFDLVGELIKVAKVESKMLAEFTNSNKVVYMKTYMLWPMKHRDFIIHAGACDASMEMDEVLLWGASPKNDKIEGYSEVYIPSEKECDTVRVDIVRMEIVCKPLQFGLKENLTRIIMVFNVDFKSYAPTSLVNWVTRTFQYALVKVLRDRCENLNGTKHDERIKTKEIYRKWRLSLMEWQRNKLKKMEQEKEKRTNDGNINNIEQEKEQKTNL